MPTFVCRCGPAFALAACVLALAACGGDDDAASGATGATGAAGATPGIRGDADPEAVAVIDAWSSALREGDVAGAAEHFAIPSIAENGPLLTRITSPEEARAFNASLPCGAELIRATSSGDFTTATFRLTERPGPGLCGLGAGGLAKTEFVIARGKIVEWRRVALGDRGGGGRVV